MHCGEEGGGSYVLFYKFDIVRFFAPLHSSVGGKSIGASKMQKISVLKC